MSSRLSPEQVDFFHHNGYLIVKEAVAQEVIAALRDFTEEQINAAAGTIIWHDQERKLATRLSFLSERGGAYLDLITSPALLDPLESLLGPDIEFCHSRHNHLLYKPPGDKGTQYHRDQRGWSRPIVTVIVALDDADLANGCLEIVPGSHRRGNYEDMYSAVYPASRTEPAAKTDTTKLPREDRELIEQAVPVLLRAGDVLLMHCCVLHGSPPNVSTSVRRSITLAYHGADELQPNDATFTLLVRGKRTEAKPGYRYTPLNEHPA